MSKPEITACAAHLGLPASSLGALQDLWDAAYRAGGSRSPSVMTTFFEDRGPVDLDSTPASDAPKPSGDRYERLGLLGAGGMGEVWRVRDRDLNRTMAMKVIRGDLMKRGTILARFIEEAQCSAQLQHPGIVPVHELGQLPTGELYFTMAEVQGRTLSEVMRDVRDASPDGPWEKASSGWTMRRLVQAFKRVCDAMAYAHTRGVVHRDLKPDNIMLGAHGEVLVVDWGLAKVVGRSELAIDAVVTDRSKDESQATRLGSVAGTPLYMPPEQARGQVDRIDARSDVYSLGAILYEILSGSPTYSGDGMTVLKKVLAGPPESVVRAGSHREMPRELTRAVDRAMARDPEHRYEDAGQLGSEIEAWLEGARRREQALEIVTRSNALVPQARELREQAAQLRAQAERLLDPIEPWDPEHLKAPGWAKEDAAAELEHEAEQVELRIEQGLFGALRIDGTLPEAHGALAERHLATHATAERSRDPEAAMRVELALFQNVIALPDGHEVRKRCTAYLVGNGTLTLHTAPPGCEVLLHRVVPQNRRLVPIFERSLGRSPLNQVSLPMGSYHCLLRHPDRPDVHYPVHIERQRHWDGAAPGAAEPQPVWIPRASEVSDEECYVPAGWFSSGGDPEARLGLPGRRLWMHDVVFQKYPVTNRRYIAYLDDLVARGHEADALRYVPRERSGTEGSQGGMIYGRTTHGRFELVPDTDGDLWLPEWPVLMVDWGCANAFAQWEASRTGLPWRLPGELEWEKAARGVDARLFPWGNRMDPSWCCTLESREGPPGAVVVQSYATDVSPYGVRGMGGNVRDFCAETYQRDGSPLTDHRVPLPQNESESPSAPRVVRGGSRLDPPASAHCATRHQASPTLRFSTNGFRLVRSVKHPG